VLSLFSGILLGLFIVHDFAFSQTFIALFELFKTSLTTPWILKTLAFVVLVGSIMALIERSGGIGGFVHFVQNKKKLVTSKRSALLLSYFLGVVIFIETSMTALISGAVGKPFCKQYGISNAKLAFVCDSTAAPIGSLIVFNGYGALLLGLISAQISLGYIDGSGIDILINSLMYNFYAIIALVVVFISIWFDIDIGPMKNSKFSEFTKDIKLDYSASKYLMILPIALMLIFVFIFLYMTGDGDILKGSGSSSVFYTMISTLIFMFVYYRLSRVMSASEFFSATYRGARHLLPVSLILLFAFGIGEVTSELKTAQYLASYANENLSIYLLASIVFLISGVMAFATGTSWGTFSIMIPIAVPIAYSMGVDTSLVLGAVISGAIFGDHTSPISDTTIISSLAAECEVVEHVKTQLPYALLSGFISLILFFIIALFSKINS